MEEKLLEILEQICEDKIVREDPDLDLVEEGLIDSIAVVELIVAIEEKFGVVLPPSEYEKEDWSTVHKIEKILLEKGVH